MPGDRWVAVLCGARGVKAEVAYSEPFGEPVDLGMQLAAEDGGWLMVGNQTGHLPGIQGRLNPILDTLDRTYLYANNVAINDGQTQPVHFVLNEPVHLTDSQGARATLWFRELAGTSCVFDYRYTG